MFEKHGPQALAGITHVFTFWQGMPDSAKRALGRLWAASPTTVGLAIVDKWHRGGIDALRGKLAEDYGFGSDLVPVGIVKVKMYGSGHVKTAYFFQKQAAKGDAAAAIQAATAKPEPTLTTEMVLSHQRDHATALDLPPPQPIPWMDAAYAEAIDREEQAAQQEETAQQRKVRLHRPCKDRVGSYSDLLRAGGLPPATKKMRTG
jgi:hypothetical protein